MTLLYNKKQKNKNKKVKNYNFGKKKREKKLICKKKIVFNIKTKNVWYI